MVAYNFARGSARSTPGTMNQLEVRFARYLEALRRKEEILWWTFQGMKFRLADNTWYSPDFDVMMPDRSIIIYETKGFWMDDAKVKIKVAADQYPYKFIAVTERRKKDGGGFKFEEFGSNVWRFHGFGEVAA